MCESALVRTLFTYAWCFIVSLVLALISFDESNYKFNGKQWFSSSDNCQKNCGNDDSNIVYFTIFFSSPISVVSFFDFNLRTFVQMQTHTISRTDLLFLLFCFWFHHSITDEFYSKFNEACNHLFYKFILLNDCHCVAIVSIFSFAIIHFEQEYLKSFVMLAFLCDQ